MTIERTRLLAKLYQIAHSECRARLLESPTFERISLSRPNGSGRDGRVGIARVSIAQACAEDLEALETLVGDSSEGLPDGARAEDRLETLKIALDDPRFHVVAARRPGVSGLVGFGVLRLIGDPGSSIAAGLISDVFVERGHRRMGVGRSMLGALIDYAKESGYGRIRLWVNVGNPIRSFYRDLGFREQRVEMERNL